MQDVSKNNPSHLKWQCLTFINWISAKPESGVSISHRDRIETARCSTAQTRQRRLAKNYPDDLKAQKEPPDQACHFGQGCKRYVTKNMQSAVMQLFLNSVGRHIAKTLVKLKNQ